MTLFPITCAHQTPPPCNVLSHISRLISTHPKSSSSFIFHPSSTSQKSPKNQNCFYHTTPFNPTHPPSKPSIHSPILYTTPPHPTTPYSYLPFPLPCLTHPSLPSLVLSCPALPCPVAVFNGKERKGTCRGIVAVKYDTSRD